ncbi:MAG: SPOR domain-containing protein [Gammaproteobacteria bacterium]|nr:SPOR domain-containing protein [Gammaproteobacteria bacterium]
MQQTPASPGRVAPIGLSESARTRAPRAPESEPGSVAEIKPSAAPALTAVPASTPPTRQVDTRPAPSPTVAAPVPVPAPTPTTASVAATGQWTLQLGAFRERVNAQRLWRNSGEGVQRLAKRPLQPAYEDEKGTTRLLLAPAMTESEARALCHQLTREGVACIPRRMP